MDGLALTLIALVAVFALLGAVSAGSFVAGRFSSGSTSKPASGTGNRVAVHDVARAQAQATAIISAANAAGHQIVRAATTKGHKQAATIIADAQKQAKQLLQEARNAAAAVAAATPPVTATQQNTGSTNTTTTPAQTTTGSGAPGSVNLSGLPSSWLVVAYNASFGAGPGSIGGISVLNRGSHTYTGVAIVRYNRGGSASASIAGLVPGQSILLPLNGSPYSGGGYSIQVNVHRVG
jgi:vacuolar-type H+-ATPase subunit H